MTEELDDVPLLEETPENDSVTPASPGCCARVRRVITVEPTVALYFLAAVSYFPTYQQYIYKQISDENGFTPSPYQNCSANVNVSQSDLEKKVQSLSSQFMLISTLVGLIPSAFATMFLGSYSDYRGRKLPLVTPFIGGCVRNFVVEIIIYFRLNIYWFLLPTALESLSGGLMTILMAGFAYTADISTLQTRTIRIFILEAMIMLCVAVTSLATGYLIRDVGFAYTFLSQFVIFVIGLVFTLFYLEETVTVRDTSLVSLTHLKEGIGLYFRAAEGGRRWKLLTMLIIILLTVGVDLGGATVSTFFLLGWPACFTSISLGIYTAVTYLSGAVLSSLSVKALGRMLVDTAFPVIGSIVSMIYQMLFGLAFSRLFIYIGKEDIEGILPKGPYPPCLRMADRALLAGYPRHVMDDISMG